MSPSPVPTYWPIGAPDASAHLIDHATIAIGPGYTMDLPQALYSVWANPTLRGQPATTWARAIAAADPEGSHPFPEWVASGLLTPWPWYSHGDTTLINDRSLLLWHDPHYPTDPPIAEDTPALSLHRLLRHIQSQSGCDHDHALAQLVATLPSLLNQPGWHLFLSASIAQAHRAMHHLQESI